MLLEGNLRDHAILPCMCVKAQEVVVSRGKVLELLRPNEMGKLVTITSSEVFGCIRALAPFRITGASTDYIIVGSDSGRIVVLQYDGTRNVFKKVHQETYGKSGCRRLVPGQFLTCDPKGRACMIASIEKQKFVYVLNRDNAANLTISSPLEAHKSNTIVFSIVGMDCGFDNPIFAAIELDYREADQVGEARGRAKHACMDVGPYKCKHQLAEPSRGCAPVVHMGGNYVATSSCLTGPCLLDRTVHVCMAHACTDSWAVFLAPEAEDCVCCVHTSRLTCACASCLTHPSTQNHHRSIGHADHPTPVVLNPTWAKYHPMLVCQMGRHHGTSAMAI